MIRDFKPSLFENTPSKNLHHTETSQRTPPTNQKPAEILEINTKASWKTTCKWVHLTLVIATVLKMNPINIKKTNAFPKQITPQIVSHRPIPIDVISCLIRQYNNNITHYIKIPLSVSCVVSFLWKLINNYFKAI